jgi:hypothetical protein
MKTRRNLLQILLLGAAMLPVVAQAQFTFITNADNTLTVTHYTGPPWTVTIPATTNGMFVTSIDGVFGNSSGKPGLTSITIPNSVTNIGFAAFDGCYSLTNVTIGKSVTSIGEFAFGYCTSLPNVTIPNSVTSIGQNAFENCTSLTSVTIPDSVTNIGGAMFQLCSSLASVTIGNSVTTIEVDFTGCTSLTNVTIPDSVTSIDGAFENCISLASVTIGNSVTNVGDYAFQSCSSLTTVAIPDSVTSIGSYAFNGCSDLTNVTIGNSVTSIGNWAFRDCTNLPNVTIPNSVTSIGSAAFFRCTSLHKAFFLGNAPRGDTTVFNGESGTAYYLPGTLGWTNRFGGWPTALWYQPTPKILGSGYGLGATSNGFAFTISWATNIPVVVEACADLANGNWCPLATNTLTSGTNYFNDSNSTNYPSRFYRIRSP